MKLTALVVFNETETVKNLLYKINYGEVYEVILNHIDSSWTIESYWLLSTNNPQLPWRVKTMSHLDSRNDFNIIMS